MAAPDCAHPGHLVEAAVCAQPDLRAAEAAMVGALEALSAGLSERALGRLQAHQQAWRQVLERDCADEVRAGEVLPLAACLLPIVKERTTYLADLQRPVGGVRRYPSLGATPHVSYELLDGNGPVALRVNARVLEAVPARLPPDEEGEYTLHALGSDVALLSGVRHRRAAPEGREGGQASVTFSYRYIDLASGRWLRGGDFFVPERIAELAMRVDQDLRQGVDADTLACYQTFDAAVLARQLVELERVELGPDSINIDLEVGPDCLALRGASVDIERVWPYLTVRYRAWARPLRAGQW